MDQIRRQALDILSQDPYQNASVIHTIHAQPDVRVLVEGSSVLAVFTDYEPVTWGYMSCGSAEEVTSLVRSSPECSGYFLTRASMREHVLLGREAAVDVVCWQYHLPPGVLVPAPAIPVTELDPSYAPYIYEHYDYAQYCTPGYVALRIRAGNALGIFEGHQLAAWIMTHDEGTMGLLNVLPQYRRKGYAAALSCALVNRLRIQGRLPFAHIHKDNDPSLSLFTRLGFICNAEICWLGFR